MKKLPDKPSEMLKITVLCLKAMNTLSKGEFNEDLLGVNNVHSMGNWKIQYGVMGAIGYAMFDIKNSFFPEELDEENYRKLWAIHFLSQGWLHAGLGRLKLNWKGLQPKYELPKINTEEYFIEITKVIKLLKEKGL